MKRNRDRVSSKTHTNNTVELNDIFKDILSTYTLNINQLKIDMNNPEIEQQLLKNREIAKLLGLNGTPAFIIGDIIYPGALKLNKLKEIIKRFRES